MFNRLSLFIYVLLLSLNAEFVYAQAQFAKDSIVSETLSVIFYNVENLFDDVDDAIQGDDEFTKNGLRAWSSFKYSSKIAKLSQVILASNNWNSPALIGVSEIENRNVVKKLCSNSILKKIGYKIIHKESKDRRGIDVALMYDPEYFFIIDSSFYEVELNDGTFSRDILYAKLGYCDDILHVFVCHWPSRYSGSYYSESKRMIASNVLFEQYSKLFSIYRNPKVLIMGDFNDDPNDKSARDLIKKSKFDENSALVNLMNDDFKYGTIKYQNRWFLFDQFIVSEGLLLDSGLSVIGKPKICNLPFILIKDDKYLGMKPFRTFSGYKYIGGYSDHFPILIELICPQNNFEIPQ